MHIINKFVDIYVSIKDDNTKNARIIKENAVCLKISTLIFSFLLSFMIDLYNFIPLTVSANIHGIKIRFCSNMLVAKNKIPFPVPNTAMLDEIVYPRQKPLNATIPKTIGIPTTVEPINHIRKVNSKLFPIDFFRSSILFIV